MHDRQSLRPKEVTNHHECDFGKWYDSAASKALRNHSAFQTTGLHHEKVHQLARQLVEAVHQNDKFRSKSLLAEFETHRKQMFAALDELYRA